MTKLNILLSFLLFGGFAFSQNVDRNPQQKVKSENKTSLQKTKDEKSGELDIVEDYRRTTIHADGSKTISIRFTEVAPNQFVQSDQEQQRVPLSKMNWIKSDLQLYLSSLENKRALVSQNPEQHALALNNGWYNFMDSVILEARALLANL